MNSISRDYAKIAVGPGWKGLIDQLYDVIDSCNDPSIHITTIKEKFGGLRIYFDGPSGEDSLSEGLNTYDMISKLVDRLEQESFRICEVCGESGVLRKRNWLKTWCDKHSQDCPPLLSDLHTTWSV